MWQTKIRYEGLAKRTIEPEARFEGGYPEWPAGRSDLQLAGRRASASEPLTPSSTSHFAPHWALFLLLPIHYIMGPVHGAIVNYCGHMIGYRNVRHPARRQVAQHADRSIS